MSLSKMLYSVLSAGLLTFINAAHAEVYDFGNQQAFASPPFSQLPLSDIELKTQYQYWKNNTFAKNDWGTWNGSGLSDSSLSKLYSMAQGSRREAAPIPAPSAAYAPEPESYAMIVAGLGLIVFTARHRK